MLRDDVFCPTPYASIVINPNGSYRLCCLTNSNKYGMGAVLDDKTGKVMNVMTHSFDEALNSRLHKHLRRAHIDGIKHEICECCYNRDTIEGDSRRVHLIRMMPQHSESYPTSTSVEQLLDKDGTYHASAVALDLRLGNLCNLACVTCGPWYSDKWYEDFKAIKGPEFIWNKEVINITSGERLGTNPLTNVPWWETDVWWNKFDEVMPRLTHIYVTAGEPMLVKAFKTLVDKLVDSGHASHVVLELDTNLTALNPHITKQWSQFKHLNLRVSLDEVGPRYDVFRWPGKFEVIDKNIRELAASKPASMKDLILTSCITPLNVFSIDEIEDYTRRVGAFPGFRYVDSPTYLDIRSLSLTKKIFMLDRLASMRSKWAAKTTKFLLDNYTTHVPQHEQEFVRVMDILDQRRSHDWRATFPLAAEMMNLD